MNTFFLLVLFNLLFLIKIPAFASSTTSNSTQTNLKKTELQWSICEPADDVYFKLTNITDPQVNTNQIYYDTENLSLLNKGIRIYTRNSSDSSDSSGETILKISFLSESEIPQEFLNNQDINCELNKYLNFEKIDCKIKSENNNSNSLFSKQQIALLKVFNIDLNYIKLKNFGPFQYSEWSKIIIQKSKINLDAVSDVDHEYVELSIRVPSEQKDGLMAQWTNYFQKQNIRICETQFERSSKLLRVSP